jgi:hypothetical protein
MRDKLHEESGTRTRDQGSVASRASTEDDRSSHLSDERSLALISDP